MASTAAAQAKEDEDEWEQVLNKAEEELLVLLDIKSTFFSVNRVEKSTRMQSIINSILTQTELGSRPVSTESLIARTCYIRGKALDCKEEYCEEAEFELARAVKLNPDECEYWNSIAHCFWKKGDLTTALSCFTTANKQKNNPVSLRELSKLLRQFPVRSSEEKASRLQESLEKAKQAVILDVSDSESWYVLGNAYVSIFFSLSPEPSLMEKALIAYGKAEEKVGGTLNPDLYFGRAQVHRYLENYTLTALDYQKAQQLDPSLPSQQAMKDMESFLYKAHDLINNGGVYKLISSKKLAQISSGLKKYELPEGVPYQLASLKSLNRGLNQNMAVALKMICPIAQSDFPPPSYLMCDCDASFLVVSLYHINSDQLRDRGSILVLNPFVAEVSYKPGHAWNVFEKKKAPQSSTSSSSDDRGAESEDDVDKDCGDDSQAIIYQYRCLQVKQAEYFLVNGKPMHAVNDAQLKLTAFDQ